MDHGQVIGENLIYRIVAEIGLKNNCTFCGVFRRQALDRGAVLLGVEQIITGHNADDIAETVLMNSNYTTNLSHERRFQQTFKVHGN